MAPCCWLGEPVPLWALRSSLKEQIEGKVMIFGGMLSVNSESNQEVRVRRWREPRVGIPGAALTSHLKCTCC